MFWVLRHLLHIYVKITTQYKPNQITAGFGNSASRQQEMVSLQKKGVGHLVHLYTSKQWTCSALPLLLRSVDLFTSLDNLLVMTYKND